MEPGPTAMEVWSPNRWTAREFPGLFFHWYYYNIPVEVLSRLKRCFKTPSFHLGRFHESFGDLSYPRCWEPLTRISGPSISRSSRISVVYLQFSSAEAPLLSRWPLGQVLRHPITVLSYVAHI